jgi:hypothetical protein
LRGPAVHAYYPAVFIFTRTKITVDFLINYIDILGLVKVDSIIPSGRLYSKHTINHVITDYIAGAAFRRQLITKVAALKYRK